MAALWDKGSHPFCQAPNRRCETANTPDRISQKCPHDWTRAFLVSHREVRSAEQHREVRSAEQHREVRSAEQHQGTST
jgi:hypothetical protein